MRIVVTGAGNPFGEAIVRALVAAGHHVRAFGLDADDARFDGLDVQIHPGWVETAGSIEPVLSERQVLVHAACLDAPGKDKYAHAVHIERGTLYARYGAEREQVDHFIHLTPAQVEKRWSVVQQQAVEHAQGTRGIVNVEVVEADEPAPTAERVLQLLESLPQLGAIEGAENAVTL